MTWSFSVNDVEDFFGHFRSLFGRLRIVGRQFRQRILTASSGNYSQPPRTEFKAILTAFAPARTIQSRRHFRGPLRLFPGPAHAWEFHGMAPQKSDPLLVGAALDCCRRGGVAALGLAPRAGNSTPRPPRACLANPKPASSRPSHSSRKRRT